MDSSSCSSDKLSSPTARAFFAALDKSKGQKSDQCSGHESKKCSSSIQKRIQTLGWRNRYSQDNRYPIQIGDANFSVLQIQRGELEGTYGTGATVWPASMVLIKYLERHSLSLVKGKRVIDLGAGTGVTSIAAALLGCTHCVCTDGEPAVVRLSNDNITYAAAHELQGSIVTSTVTSEGNTSSAAVIRNCLVTTETYWWGKGRIQAAGDIHCDLVLVSDCVLPKLYPISPLVDALDELLTSPNALAILSYEHRFYPDYDPREKFRELCENKQLIVQQIPIEEQDHVYSVDDIEIWHVARKNVIDGGI